VRARIRRVLAIAGVVVLLMVVGVGAEWAITPPVGDAQQRVQAFAADHHSSDLDAPVPAKVTTALVATEDSRFYSHHGIDGVGIARSILGVFRLGGSCLRHAPRDLPLLDVGTGDNESMTEASPALVQRGADVASPNMFNSAVRGTDRQDQVASMPMLGQ